MSGLTELVDSSYPDFGHRHSSSWTVDGGRCSGYTAENRKIIDMIVIMILGVVLLLAILASVAIWSDRW